MSTISVTNIADGDAVTAASVNNQVNTIVNDYNGGITASNLASNAVTTVKITDANVTPAKWTNPYKFRAYRNAAANTSSGTFAKVSFDTENYDSNSNFASGTYTAPVAGFYQFNAAIQFSTSSSSFVVSLYKNGSEISRGSRGKASADLFGGTVSDILQLSASDTVEVYVFCSSTLALDIIATTNNYFSGYLVSVT